MQQSCLGTDHKTQVTLSHPRCAFCRSDPSEIYRRFSRGEPLSRVAVVQGRSEPQTRKKCWSLFVPHKRNHRPDPLACSWNQARRMMGSRRSGRHPATMTTAVSVTSSAALLTRRLNLRKTRVGCRRTPVSSQAPASYQNDFPPSLSLSKGVLLQENCVTHDALSSLQQRVNTDRTRCTCAYHVERGSRNKFAS